MVLDGEIGGERRDQGRAAKWPSGKVKHATKEKKRLWPRRLAGGDVLSCWKGPWESEGAPEGMAKPTPGCRVNEGKGQWPRVSDRVSRRPGGPVTKQDQARNEENMFRKV